VRFSPPDNARGPVWGPFSDPVSRAWAQSFPTTASPSLRGVGTWFNPSSLGVPRAALRCGTGSRLMVVATGRPGRMAPNLTGPVKVWFDSGRARDEEQT